MLTFRSSDGSTTIACRHYGLLRSGCHDRVLGSLWSAGLHSIVVENQGVTSQAMDALGDNGDDANQPCNVAIADVR